MNKLNKKVASRHARRSISKKIAAGILLAGIVMPLSAQIVVTDSVLLDFIGADSLETWKQSQRHAYVLDHLLQKPTSVKRFEKKKFADRLYIEAGGGIFAPLALPEKLLTVKPKASFMLGVGDWITPEHGVRMNFLHGQSNSEYGQESSFTGLSLDYIMNITAIGSREYNIPKFFELYGIAGLDYFTSDCDDKKDNAFGMHIGMRGQFNLKSNSYFFLEPRIGAYSDKLFHQDSWRGYSLGATVLAGLGYRLVPDRRSKDRYATSGSFLDNTFFSLSAGPRMFLNDWSSSENEDDLGIGVRLHVGKWFNPNHGARFGLGVSGYQNGPAHNLKAVAASLGYMVNLHNMFSGYDTSRKFWVNLVADASLDMTGEGRDRKVSYGIGGGFQANLNLFKGVDFFVEPRIDVYQTNYAKFSGGSDLDVVGSVYGGLIFRQGLNTAEQLRRNEDFEQTAWNDHLFFESSLGFSKPITTTSTDEFFHDWGPKAQIGIGKWFTPTVGVKVWGQGGTLKDDARKKYRTLTAGVSAMWNLTNALHGYDPTRPCELHALAGLNASTRTTSSKVFIGGHAALKGLLRLNDTWGIFIEPEVQIYRDDYMHQGSLTILKKNDFDAIGSLMAGVQMELSGYAPKLYSEAFEAEEYKSFISIAGGVGYNFIENGSDVKGIVSGYGRASFGKWFAPHSAWRVNAESFVAPRFDDRYGVFTFSGDYISDFTALAYGYNPDRLINLRGIVGVGLGFDYDPKHLTSKLKPVGNVQLGGQLAFRVGNRNEIFAEPKVSYLIGGSSRNYGMQAFLPTAMLGINHKLQGSPAKKSSLPSPEKKEFFSVALGTGAHTGSLFTMTPFRKKLTIEYDLNYGHWLNAIHGWRVGLGGSTVKDKQTGHRQITTLHADYMFNLLALARGEEILYTDWTMSGFVGANFSMCSCKPFDKTNAFGGNAGLHFGYKFKPNMEIFLEPSITVTDSKIWTYSWRPIEGQCRAMLGIQYYL